MSYEFTNLNPRYKREPDCVVNTIGLALDMDWQDTYVDIVNFCIPLYLNHSGKRGIQRYLMSRGYDMSAMPTHCDKTRYTVAEFALELNVGTYILSVANHLTLVREGVILDTWNCSHKSVGNYWKIK